MSARPLSPEEIAEMDNLIAECELNPQRLRAYCAELIRLREFAGFSARYAGSLPRKVREALDHNIPKKSERQAWIDAGMENAIEHDIHMPDPVRPPRLRW